ncbi:MAG: hypothetical protein AB3N09_05730 [Tateyamaria sp.]
MLRLVSVVLALAPLPALALSCMPHGVPDAYLDAAGAEEGYVPVLGKLTFDASALPQVDWDNQQDVPGVTLIPARFEGEALTVRGVAQPFETDVVLEVQCFGPWCPRPDPGAMLGFLRKTSHSYVLHTNACGGYLFGNPTQEQVGQMKDCLAGRRCTPSAPR